MDRYRRCVGFDNRSSSVLSLRTAGNDLIARLDVDVVLPNLLLGPSTKAARLQNRTHLVKACEQVPACHEPTNAFRARRCGQAALVRPIFVDILDLLKRGRNVQIERLLDVSLVPVDHGCGELLDE